MLVNCFRIRIIWCLMQLPPNRAPSRLAENWREELARKGCRFLAGFVSVSWRASVNRLSSAQRRRRGRRKELFVAGVSIFSVTGGSECSVYALNSQADSEELW